jgi:hypothetical protein
MNGIPVIPRESLRNSASHGLGEGVLWYGEHT